jgi:DNA-binding NarL/FixJ family response regulator
MIRILIADDQELLCEILQTSLEKEVDLQIVGRANNGQEALEKIARLRPNIALIDINMPIMDGLTATEKISHTFPETKVIVLSGSEGESDRINALNAGAKSYVPKTAKAIEIIEQIRLVYRQDLATESEIKLEDKIIQLNRIKQDIREYCQIIDQKIEKLEQTQTTFQQDFARLKTEQKQRSEEMFSFKSNIESMVKDFDRSAKKSKYHTTEINKLQTLLEGQLSYIHNLNKRFNLLRKYSLIASGIAGIALLFSFLGLIVS